MAVDYRELNKVTPRIYAAVPNTAQLLDTISSSLKTYRCVSDLSNAFLSIPLEGVPRTSVPSRGKGDNGLLLSYPKVICIVLLYVIGWWPRTWRNGLFLPLLFSVVTLMISC